MKRTKDKKDSNLEKRSSGFTLIELMLALLISTILTLISLTLYQHSVRRSALQGEAIALAARLEQAKTLAQSMGRQYRILLNKEGRNYIPERFDQDSGWVAADDISGRPIDLSSIVSYGFPAEASSPNYGPLVASITTATPPAPSAIQFNSRGFPVAVGDPLPLAIRPENAVYLTDGRDNFAVTVDILGHVRVWAYNGMQWVLISR
jgi:prepilin-type N-terminal cleavage/methylation domain-containing protein